jgi:hypothetical protein
VNDEGEKSRAFKKFEAYFFSEDNLSIPLFHFLDPWTITELSEEEKKIAEKMVIAALTKKYDRRWVYALEEIKSKTAYKFLFDWYKSEETEYIKVRLAYALVRIDGKAPVLDYIQKILSSNTVKDSKAKVLGCFTWIKDAGFESEETEQLFRKILFDTLTDKTKDVRLYSYEILRDYYNMRDFTPIDDEVYNILSKRAKKSEYEKAAQLFKDRVVSIKVFPVKKEIIADHIKTLPDNPPTLKISECKVCSTIPESVSADIAAGNSLEEHKSKLERVIIFAYYSNCIMRCPFCGRLYMYKYEYEFLVGWSSEEDEYLWRTDTKEAIALARSFLKSYDFKHIIICNIFLKTTY